MRSQTCSLHRPRTQRAAGHRTRWVEDYRRQKVSGGLFKPIDMDMPIPGEVPGDLKLSGPFSRLSKIGENLAKICAASLTLLI